MLAVRSEKPAYAAGTYGAKLPAKSALHNHQHAAGFRGGMSSQSNPFSRVPKVEVASKRGSGDIAVYLAVMLVPTAHNQKYITRCTFEVRNTIDASCHAV